MSEPLVCGADVDPSVNAITGQIVDAAITVHRELGPGFKEAHYEEALCRELTARGLRWSRQHRVTVLYRGMALSRSYRLDLLVEDRVVVEIKVAEALTALHRAQLLGYLRATGCTVGLAINFQTTRLVDQIMRVVSTRSVGSAPSANSAPADRRT